MAVAQIKKLGSLVVSFVALLALSGCIGGLFGGDSENASSDSLSNLEQESRGDWIPFFGKDDPDQGNRIGVNNYLWRASLDTLSFMPLQAADPFGGVIISDWYEDPAAPGERFKVTIYILDQRLRADGIKVAVFRQQQSAQKAWADAPVNAATAADLENAILTRARQLRVDSIAQN